jgi:hypothetical protein
MEHNATTGEVIEREMNAEELAQQKVDQAKAEAEKQAAATKAAEKAALLERLGLTQDEAALLLS